MLLRWEMTYLMIGQCCLLIALVNLFLLEVHPEDKGIIIEEIDEGMNRNEELLRKHNIESGSTNEAENPIRNYDTMTEN
jgi:sugar phosphate permease